MSHKNNYFGKDQHKVYEPVNSTGQNKTPKEGTYEGNTKSDKSASEKKWWEK